MFRNQVFGKNKIMMCGNSRYVELKKKVILKYITIVSNSEWQQ